jgi:TPR repeat protein
MKTRTAWRWNTLLSVLVLVPSLALGQSDPDDPDPGLTAFRAGDFKMAHGLWQVEANMGDPNSQFNLGYLYESGKGVEVDYEAAFTWYNEAAKNECRMAQYNLANLYMAGRGVAVNHDKAIELLAKCVRPGGTCREQIGTMLEYVEQKLTWYSDQGYAAAQYELGSMALDRGDFTSATAWVQKAAQGGHGPAQVALATSYLNGDGIEQDVEKGAQLLFQAMLQHREDAAVLRGAKSTAASAYYAGQIEASERAINAYVWARLVLEDHPESGSFMNTLYGQMAADAMNAMTDGQVGTAFFLSSRWAELFEAGLPGVTEEHLRTLDAPQ